MMNINNYGPKSVNLDAEMKKVPTYEGTLKTMVDENKITLTVTDSGEVTGFWVDSGLPTMLDNLAGNNFARAYCCLPVMNWLQLIMDAKYKGPAIERIDEKLGVIIYSDGSTKQYKEAHHIRDLHYASDGDDELPDCISLEDLDLDEEFDDRDIRRAIKNYTGYFVARDCNFYVDDGMVYDIEYGRKASASELD